MTSQTYPPGLDDGPAPAAEAARAGAALTTVCPRAKLAALMRRLLLIALTAALAASLNGGPAAAQSLGTALLSSPRPGEAVSGIVILTGTAAGPQFLRYELAFGYDVDPTNTWFSIQDPVTTPVEDSALGRWDTTGLTAGLYVVRLRVYTSEREFVDAIVRGVRVSNATTPAAATAPSTPEPEPTPLPVPTATAPLIALPPVPTPRPTAGAGNAAGRTFLDEANLSAEAVRAAFGQGIQLSLLAFGLLGLYLGLRQLVRALLRRWRP